MVVKILLSIAYIEYQSASAITSHEYLQYIEKSPVLGEKVILPAQTVPSIPTVNNIRYFNTFIVKHYNKIIFIRTQRLLLMFFTLFKEDN